METPAGRTYEAGFIDGIEYAAQLNLKEVLQSFIRLMDEFRQRRSIFDKCEYVVQKILDLSSVLREKRLFGLNGYS